MCPALHVAACRTGHMGRLKIRHFQPLEICYQQRYTVLQTVQVQSEDNVQYEILLTKDPNNGYTARPLTMPELTVAADNELEALALVRQAITKLQQTSRIVQIDVPSLVDDSTNDPGYLFLACGLMIRTGKSSKQKSLLFANS
jgi:hypothetical protein